MTPEHLTAALSAAEAKKTKEGWVMAEGRHLTLYVASGGVSLTVSRVETLQLEGQLIRAKTVRGETFLLALEDAFAAQVEAAAQGSRRAGFG